MEIILSVHWVLGAALWFLINGILHDIFVVINHKGNYNRDLLRLLMDGHVLILSGAILLVCYVMLLNKISSAAVIGIIVGVGMLAYCFMIFPFLKSFITMAISVLLIIVCIRLCLVSPNIFQIVQNLK
ncbi:MAG: hypothetical protein JWO06_1540 [Bacteroidota bacterium]|nr:hypothetical protein [Bacteroidota bacterium]